MLTQSIIFSGGVVGVFSIFLLQSKIEKSKADHWLMICLGLNSCLMLFYFDNLDSQPQLPKIIQFFCFSLPLLSSPILYFYIKSLSLGWVFNWKQSAFHFFPFLLVITLFIFHFDYVYISKGFPHYQPQTSLLVIFMTTFPLAIVSGFYNVLSLKALFKYQKSLPDNYSFTEKITLNWLKWIVLTNILMFFVLFFLIKFGVQVGFLTYQNLFEVVAVILSIYIFFISYFGLKQTTIFTNFNYNSGIEEAESIKTSYRNSGLSEANIDELFEKLEAHIRLNKPYLDENLNLFTLSQQMGLTTNQLSQVINQKTTCNFFNYINRYRIEAVKEKLKDPKFAHYSILAIGFDCGFRSKSSFNKIFKDQEGVTPSDFQKNQKI